MKDSKSKNAPSPTKGSSLRAVQGPGQATSGHSLHFYR